MRKVSRWLNAVLFLLILSLAACSGESVSRSSDPEPAPGRTALGLHLNSSWDGATGSIELEATHAAELHQLSCRIGYDPQTARPLGIERGSLVDERAVFFSTTKAEHYVPVAFTYHLGETIPAVAGSVASIQFEQLNSDVTPNIWIIDEPDFLIARDANAQSIPIDPGGGH